MRKLLWDKPRTWWGQLLEIILFAAVLNGTYALLYFIVHGTVSW